MKKLVKVLFILLSFRQLYEKNLKKFKKIIDFSNFSINYTLQG